MSAPDSLKTLVANELLIIKSAAIVQDETIMRGPGMEPMAS